MKRLARIKSIQSRAFSQDSECRSVRQVEWAKPSAGQEVAWCRPCSQCLPIHNQSQDAFSKGSVIKNGKGQDSPSNGHVMPWNNSGSWRKGFQTLVIASLSILCLQSPKVMPFHGKGHMDQEKSQRQIT